MAASQAHPPAPAAPGCCISCGSHLLPPHPQSQHGLHTHLFKWLLKIPLSNAPPLSVLISNFQLRECSYWDNDLFLVGSPLPPPRKKKIVGIQSHRGTNWEQTVLCVSKSLQFWPELSFNKRSVEGERAQVGLSQSSISSEHQRAKSCGSPLGARSWGDLVIWKSDGIFPFCPYKVLKKKKKKNLFGKLETFTKAERTEWWTPHPRLLTHPLYHLKIFFC